MATKKEIVRLVADKVLEKLEKGIIPWRQPYVDSVEGLARSYVTGKPYSILNRLLLPDGGEYLTYNQITKQGGHVRKGEKGHRVIFFSYKEETEKVIKEDGTVEEKKWWKTIYIPHTVFHISQCEGVTPHETPGEREAEKDIDAEAIVDRYVKADGVKIVSAGAFGAPSYNPENDTVFMPGMERFVTDAAYYNALFHELVHSTGHEVRLDRKLSSDTASRAYGQEELIAEMGATVLCHEADIITPELFDNSVAYIGGWIRSIRENPEIVLAAARAAEKAVKYILVEDEEGKKAVAPAVEAAMVTVAA